MLSGWDHVICHNLELALQLQWHCSQFPSWQVTRDVAQKMETMVGGLTNPRGCPIPTTWFVLGSGTDCYQAKKLYDAGHEMASHTLTHQELTTNVEASTAKEEIIEGRNYLIDNCGLPKKDIVGFRSTYLTTNPIVKSVSWQRILYVSWIAADMAVASFCEQNKNEQQTKQSLLLRSLFCLTFPYDGIACQDRL